jgi:hypothetical protein
MLVSTVLTEAYRKLGRPSQVDMPYQDLISIVKDVVRGLYLDLKLSARAHTTEQGNWVIPSAREMSSAVFTGGGYIIPVSAEWRYADSGDDAVTFPVEIVAYEQISWDGVTWARPVVAFYNDFLEIRFSDIEDILFNREYRITYEAMSDVDVNELTDTVQIPDLFTSYLSDEAAVRTLDYIDGNEAWAEKRARLRPLLMMALLENKGRFIKWQNTQFGNKKIEKRSKFLRRYRY